MSFFGGLLKAIFQLLQRSGSQAQSQDKLEPKVQKGGVNERPKSPPPPPPSGQGAPEPIRVEITHVEPEPEPVIEPVPPITMAQLEVISGLSGSKLAPFRARALKFVDHLAATCQRFRILSPLQRAHFMAQLMHESGALRYTEELASGQAYEGRKDLGNVEPGDGVKFKGRGLIQLTGRSNYRAFGGYLGTDLTVGTNYALVARPELSCVSAGWFWVTKRFRGSNLNDLAENDDAILISYLVNGGMNGIRDRLEYLARAYRAFDLDAPSRIEKVLSTIESHMASSIKTGLAGTVKRAFPDAASLEELRRALHAQV